MHVPCPLILRSVLPQGGLLHRRHRGAPTAPSLQGPQAAGSHCLEVFMGSQCPRSHRLSSQNRPAVGSERRPCLHSSSLLALGRAGSWLLAGPNESPSSSTRPVWAGTQVDKP